MNANPPKARRDPHAGDKRELAESHRRKKLPVDNPGAHEGKPITSQGLQERAARELREEAERLEAEARKKPPQSESERQTSSQEGRKKNQAVEEGASETETVVSKPRISKESAIAQGWPPSSDWDYLTKDWTGEEQALLLQFVGWAIQKFTLAGPYPQKKGNPRYVVLHGKEHVKEITDKKIIEAAEQVWTGLGGVRTIPEEKPKGSRGLTIEEMATDVQAQEAPFVETVARRFSWWELGLNSLGEFAYNKLTEAGLLKVDDWYVSPVPGEADKVADIAKLSHDKFTTASRNALGKLLQGLNAANEIVRLESELEIETGRYLMEKQKLAVMQARAQYFEDFTRLAQGSMCANDQRELFEKLVIRGLIDVQKKSELTALTPKIAEEEAPKP